MPYRIAVFAALVLFVGMDARAQGRERYPEGTVRVVLTDGSRHLGTIESESDESLVLVTLAGVRMTIPRAQILRTESIAGEKFFRADPNRSRLLFAPTARPLPHGSGYVAVYEVFFPFVAVGVLDVVTLAGGISLIPGASDQLLYAAPKVSFYQRDGLQLGAGGIFGIVTGGQGSAGMFFGIGTIGPSHASVTVGAGLGFAESEFSTRPVLLIAGEYQLSNSVKLVSENYIITGVEEGVLAAAGIRFFGDRLAADLALATVPLLLDEAEGFPFFPWIGFAYNFGR